MRVFLAQFLPQMFNRVDFRAISGLKDQTDMLWDLQIFGPVYVCYSRTGIGGGFEVTSLSVTQEYEGAQDLDIKPADNTATVQVCRLWVDAGKPITGLLRYDTTAWTSNTSIELNAYKE